MLVSAKQKRLLSGLRAPQGLAGLHHIILTLGPNARGMLGKPGVVPALGFPVLTK